jgi:C-terminal processing protease CtpA/Prc
MQFDCSGIYLAAMGDKLRTFVITAVGGESPAFRAGLAVGDEIVAIDTTATSTLDLDGVRALLRQDGKTVTVKFKHNGEEKTVLLALRMPA